MHIVQGNTQYRIAETLRQLQDKDYKYDYGDYNFKPGTDTHDKLVSHVMRAGELANESITQRHKSWRNIDRVLTAYIPLDDAERALKDKDSRKPVSIVFPYSFAVRETLLTYMTNVFFQDPIFRLEGVSPDDTIGAILLEKVIQQHCLRSKVILPAHTALSDGISYGIGISSPAWVVKQGYKVRARKTTDSNGNVTSQSKVTSLQTIFSGNELRSVDPYRYLPDPSVSVQNIQKGQYVGWVDQTNYYDLRMDESIPDNELFNIKYLKDMEYVESSLDVFNNDRNIRTSTELKRDSGDSSVERPVSLLYMYMKIIPAQFGLSNSDIPEKWLFVVANESVLIQAKPLNMNHNQYPIAVCAPDFDGYSCSPLSRIEMLYGLQTTLDWFFNSHIANVRKSLNDTLIVDPYLINLKDVYDPKPGKVIRTRRPAWGRGVDNAIKQLTMNDVTQGHIRDAGLLVNWMNQVGGADEAAMGMQRQSGPDRKTAQEYLGTKEGGLARMSRMARVIGAMYFQDIGYQFASNTQQLMEQEEYVKVNGQWAETLIQNRPGLQYNDKAKVDPYDILVDYDINVRDGSLSGGNFNPEVVNLFREGQQSAELNSNMDMTGIFCYIMQQMGFKDVNDFKRADKTMMPQVANDEQVRQEADAGNLISVGDLNGI